MEYYTVEDLNNLPAQMIPTSLFKNPNYPKEKLCNNAKWVYSFLFNRLILSARNGWVDEDGHVYVIFTRQEMADLLEVSEPTIVKCFAELVNCDLLEETSQGHGKAYILYPGMVKQADTQNSLVPEEDATLKENGVPKEFKPSIKSKEIRDTSTDKNQAANQDACQNKLKEKESTSLYGQHTLFHIPAKPVDVSKMSKHDKALARVKYARQTNNWESVTYQDLTFYFVHLHNQIMPDKLLLSASCGVQVQIFRDYFITRLKIPFSKFHTYAKAFIETYKTSTLVSPKYATAMNFSFFKIEKLVDMIMEQALVRLDIEAERQAKPEPKTVRHTDEVEVW